VPAASPSPAGSCGRCLNRSNIARAAATLRVFILNRATGNHYLEDGGRSLPRKSAAPLISCYLTCFSVVH
jgi:hypothetical protein